MTIGNTLSINGINLPSRRKKGRVPDWSRPSRAADVRDWSRASHDVSWTPEQFRDPPSPRCLKGWRRKEWDARFERRVAAGFAEPLTALLGEPMTFSRGDAGRYYHTPPNNSFDVYQRRRARPGSFSWRSRVVVEHWPIADHEFAPHAERAVRDMIADRDDDIRLCARLGSSPPPFGFSVVLLPRRWAWRGPRERALLVLIGMAEDFSGLRR